MLEAVVDGDDGGLWLARAAAARVVTTEVRWERQRRGGIGSGDGDGGKKENQPNATSAVRKVT